MTVRATAALMVVLAGLLCGCSSLFHKQDAEAPKAQPQVALYELEIEAPGPLRKLLSDYLDLSRFRTLPDTEGITLIEVDRMVAASHAQARALLETEGYFNADVKVQRTTLPDGKPLLHVRVDPGPRTRVTKWSVDAVGEVKERADAGKEDAVVEIASLRRSWDMKDGEPFRQPEWSSSKNATLGKLRGDGYAAATWQRTQALVDADNNSAALSLTADSGPLFLIGSLSIEGLQRYDEQSVRRLATFYLGDAYSEQALLDYQERLIKVGLFEGSIVEIDPNPETAKAAPVVVRVKELPLQSATLGAGYSGNTGPRVTLEHLHRRPFGIQWIAKNKFELGPSLKSWQADLTSHPLSDLYRNLIAGGYERLRTADELRSSWNVRVGKAQDKPHYERLIFAELVHSRLDTTAASVSSDAVSANYHWIRRRVDSLLLPTKGTTLSVQLATGVAFGREIKSGGITDGRGPFGRGYARFTWYQPLPASWYATTRVEGGQVFAAGQVGLPDTLLFRAGGDESVRGYAYRTLGPVVDGVVTSGRVLFTGSAEIARPISAKLPSVWWAAFIDAGDAANRWNQLHPAVGIGTGVRWRSPVGPLRVDVAYGQRVRKARLHLSVGVAF